LIGQLAFEEVELDMLTLEKQQYLEMRMPVQCERVGFDLAATFTPLLQTNFLPLLIQVYLIPADVLTWPSFLQAVPGFTAAVAVERLSERTKQPITMVADIRFISPRITTR
jgi:hypothetical protein